MCELLIFFPFSHCMKSEAEIQAIFNLKKAKTKAIFILLNPIPGSLSSEGRLKFSKHWTTSDSTLSSVVMKMGKGNDSNMVPKPAGFQGSSQGVQKVSN